MTSSYEVVKEWRKKNPEKVKEQHRRYAKKHPETNEKAVAKYRATNMDRIRELDKENHRRAREQNPEQQRERYERWRAKKELQLTKEAGRPRPQRCELCGKKTKTVFDHCHRSNKFRGWICDRCNRVLGSVDDSTALLKRMIRYLEANDGQKITKDDRQATTGITQITIWASITEEVPDGH
jgi:hypothetical protein